MSTEYTFWIPAEPAADPPADLPDGGEITLATTDQLCLVVSENAERFNCPRCSAVVPVDWLFGEADRVFSGGGVITQLPCGHEESLNNLDAGEPYGFSRWTLEAREFGGDLETKTSELSAALGQPLRVVICRF